MPLGRFYFYMKVLRFFLCVLLIFLYSKSQAEVGCYFPNSGRLYYVRINNDNWDGRYSRSMSVACLAPGSGAATPCHVTGGAGGAGGDGGANGLEGDWSPTYCPLDSKAWLLIFATGLVGYFFIRKRIMV